MTQVKRTEGSRAGHNNWSKYKYPQILNISQQHYPRITEKNCLPNKVEGESDQNDTAKCKVL